MDRMWSPWRSEHVTRSTTEDAAGDGHGTLFSRLAAEKRDDENLIVWRGTTVFVIMNRYPYNNGHLMIVPYREVDSYEALTGEEQVEIARAIEHCMRWLRQALDPEGFNVGINQGRAAGAGVPDHLHVHVVPRWKGDTNFMATVSDLRVIPEGMEQTYRKLRSAVREEETAG